MVGINPTISAIALDINGLNSGSENKTELYIVYSIATESRLVGPGNGGGAGENYKETQGILGGDECVHYLDCGGGFVIEYTCQNSPNCTFCHVKFSVC